MLARLTELDGVVRAEVDRAGDLLRLTLDRDVRDASIALLRELGYDADLVTDAPTTAGWYGTTSVNELSRIEAGAIADRVVPRFAREHQGTLDQGALREVVVGVLHRCFTERALGAGNTGTFRQDCVRAVAAAAVPIIGVPSAEALAGLLEDDLVQDHRH
ncbi:MAG TPA: hypothetical protein VGA38_12705 [Candidatus Limnocylindria bacterium]